MPDESSPQYRVTMATLADVTPDPENAREHNPTNLGLIQDSLQQNGAGRSILLDENNKIIAGHGTVDAAGAAGMENLVIVDAPGDALVAIRRSNLTPEQKRRLALFDNYASDTSTFNTQLLGQWALDDPGILHGIFADDEIAAWADAVVSASIGPPQPGAGGDEYDTTPDPTQNRVQYGDIWQVGRHRVMCGDSEQEADLAALLAGAAPAMIHTDPPYGKNIVRRETGQVGGSKPWGSRPDVGTTVSATRKSSHGFDGRLNVRPDKIIQSNVYPEIHGDDHPFDPSPWIGAAPVVILWGANYYAERLPASPCWICWDKRENITRNTFADCELAWCSRPSPARIFHHLWNGLHKGSQHGERRTHPTEKPVALFQEIGTQYAPTGPWLDAYAGTGAQLIAAERAGVACYCMELEPAYCDVILRRAEAEGISPIIQVKGGTHAEGPDAEG